MGVQTSFSSFETTLSPASFACFKVLFEKARSESGAADRYEIPVADFLEASGAANVEDVATAIREIIKCKVEIKKEEYLIFSPFFASVSIDKGIISYSVPPEVHAALPGATVNFDTSR
jgi:hypothetical protein